MCAPSPWRRPRRVGKGAIAGASRVGKIADAPLPAQRAERRRFCPPYADYVPAIPVLRRSKNEDVDARHAPAHDGAFRSASQLATNTIEIGVSLKTPAAVSPKKSCSPGRRLTPMTMRLWP